MEWVDLLRRGVFAPGAGELFQRRPRRACDADVHAENFIAEVLQTAPARMSRFATSGEVRLQLLVLPRA